MFLENGNYASCHPREDLALVQRGNLFFAGHGRWTSTQADAWVFTAGAADMAATQLGHGAKRLLIEPENANG
jgi:hypothetical protein